jgi:hypothetical protein
VTTRRGGTLIDANHQLLALRAVAHVAAHDLGAAAYAIKAALAAAPEGLGEAAGRLVCQWQRDQLADAVRALVLDDQRLRHDICWSVFAC